MTKLGKYSWKWIGGCTIQIHWIKFHKVWIVFFSLVYSCKLHMSIIFSVWKYVCTRPHNIRRHRRPVTFCAPTNGLGALEISLLFCYSLTWPWCPKLPFYIGHENGWPSKSLFWGMVCMISSWQWRQCASYRRRYQNTILCKPTPAEQIHTPKNTPQNYFNSVWVFHLYVAFSNIVTTVGITSTRVGDFFFF